jgi:putative hemolysin
MDIWYVERLLVIAALICGAAFFAGSETALFSLTRVEREAMAQKDAAAGRRVLRLLDDPRRVIVTIILGNELINITASTITANITARLTPDLHQMLQVLITTAWTVPLILLFGEMVPKSIAIRTGARWALYASRMLELVMWLISPLRWVLYVVSGVFVRIVGGKDERSPEGLREEEFLALVDVGSETGELQVGEKRLIHNVFQFGDKTVGQIMTPAEKVFALPYEMPLGRLVETIGSSKYSRVPIYRSRGAKPAGQRRSPLDVVGLLLAKDLIGYRHGRLEGHTVQDLLHPPLFVPRTTKCDTLFREFQRRKTHQALVVDEYGQLAGLVTMEDLLQELFGEIADEKESHA